MKDDFEAVSRVQYTRFCCLFFPIFLIFYLFFANLVLGSFQERVRRSPIRLAEVMARNLAGSTGGRTEGIKQQLLIYFYFCK
jgi:hypothetical protein